MFDKESSNADNDATLDAQERKWSIRVVEVREMWATVEAETRQQAERIVKANLDIIEAEVDIPELDDVGDWDFPQPIDSLAIWVDDIREV